MKTKGGFTLVEVLLATAILAVGLIAIFSAITPCLVMISASKQFQEVRWVLGMAEVKYPLADFEDIEDIIVEETDDFGDEEKVLSDGYKFERTVDRKVFENSIDDTSSDIDDGILVVRTKVSWGDSDEMKEEIVQLVWKKDAGEWDP